MIYRSIYILANNIGFMKYLTKRKIGIAGLVGVLFINGCGTQNLNSYQSLDYKIHEANKAYQATDGHDVSGLISLVDEYEGDLSRLLYICRNSVNDLFCTRYASQQNPDLREEICEPLKENYSIEAFEECLDGLPAVTR